ncbi:hypothetical protein, partial [uncultured Herbaspirillum sp.]|uniref:hypothetical protein n=1 Tax=uncultured Herbaspirillum sp. TaxID=160236 RepID=UPI0025836524
DNDWLLCSMKNGPVDNSTGPLKPYLSDIPFACLKKILTERHYPHGRHFHRELGPSEDADIYLGRNAKAALNALPIVLEKLKPDRNCGQCGDAPTQAYSLLHVQSSTWSWQFDLIFNHNNDA